MRAPSKSARVDCPAAAVEACCCCKRAVRRLHRLHQLVRLYLNLSVKHLWRHCHPLPTTLLQHRPCPQRSLTGACLPPPEYTHR